MKKVFCICAAALLIAALSTSCNKNCKCTTYFNGKAQSTTEIENPNPDGHCSDMNTVVVINGKKNGIECKGSL